MRLRATLPQMRGDHWPEVVHPAAHGLVRDRDAALREQILNVTKAQREPEIEPNRLMYHLGREPISGVADFPHSLGYSAYLHPTSCRRRDKADHSGLAWRQRQPAHHGERPPQGLHCLSFRTSTTTYAKRLADGDPVVRQQVTLPNVIAIPGGLPIKVGDDFIGGVGVSGSPGVDDPCVQAGLDKVADQLN